MSLDKIQTFIAGPGRELIDEVFNLTVPPGAEISHKVKEMNDLVIECVAVANQAKSEEERKEYLDQAESYARAMAHYVDMRRLGQESEFIEQQRKQFALRALSFASKLAPIVIAAI